MSRGWIGVDLDGTLAVYDGWRGADHVGIPVPAMLQRVKRWLKEGREIRIMTARVSKNDDEEREARAAIEEWCLEWLGQVLPVTACKDYAMVELWDDKCVTVEHNTGLVKTIGKGGRHG